MPDPLDSDTAEPQDQRGQISPADPLKPLLQGGELVKDFLASESYSMFFELISDIANLGEANVFGTPKPQGRELKYLYFYHCSVCRVSNS